MQILFRAAGAAALATVFAACGGGASSNATIPTSGSVGNPALLESQSVQRALMPAGAGRLYVANFYGGDVSVFDTAQRNAPLAVITGGGMTNPNGAALDADGKLYIPNGGPSNRFAHTVSEFDTLAADAALTPIPVGAPGPPQVPLATAVAGGKLYLANGGSDNFGAHRIMVFSTAPGHARLTAISGGGLNGPVALAIDAGGKLYAANFKNNTVSIFDTLHGDAPLAVIRGGGIAGPNGLAVDAHGKLYVVNTSTNSISVFDTTNGNAPLTPITGGNLVGPGGAAIDADGKLYVTNGIKNSVSVFDTQHGNAALAPITGGGLNYPTGVAVR